MLVSVIHLMDWNILVSLIALFLLFILIFVFDLCLFLVLSVLDILGRVDREQSRFASVSRIYTKVPHRLTAT